MGTGVSVGGKVAVAVGCGVFVGISVAVGSVVAVGSGAFEQAVKNNNPIIINLRILVSLISPVPSINLTV